MAVTVQTGTYAQLGPAADSLYRAVFIDEQGVPEDEIFDGLAPKCLFAVAFDGNIPAAAARLLPERGSVWRIGLVATDKAKRGQGFGGAVMRAAIDAVRVRGGMEIVLNAQSTAVGFYEKLGFRQNGAEIRFPSGFVLVPMLFRV